MRILSVLITIATLVNLSSTSLVIIMLDGFRWDYISRLSEQELPNFKAFEAAGVKAEHVETVFPSLSWPSWTTIVTGLYPESHGIVGNYMYDPVGNREFRPHDHSTSDDLYWWQNHIPLWITTTNKGLKTSLYYWSRCDLPFNGVTPAFCIPNDYLAAREISLFKDNLASAANDINNKGFNVSFVYYANTDHMGHAHGPDSEEMMKETMAVDGAIGEFMSMMKSDANVIITTDHGMSAMDDKVYKKLVDAVPNSDLDRVVEYGAYANIDLAPGVDVDAAVAAINAEFDGMDAYKTENVPEHLYYNKHELIHDVVMVSKGAQMVSQDGRNPNTYLPEATPDSNGVKDKNVGNHGWSDNTPNRVYDRLGNFNDMRGVFMAQGPAFKGTGTVPWIKLVDEYNVFLRVLGIEGEKNNGSESRINAFFEPPSSSSGKIVASALSILLVHLAL